jgi:REP element-mobilizing transposase RayT
MGRRVSRQKSFVFRTWGGKRKGAGRKRTSEKARVAHRTRREVDGRTPVHVTLRLLPEIARLRRRAQYRAIREALARTAHRADSRICHYSVQSNHLHLVVEPMTKSGLARGMMAFKSSCAKRLNGLVARRGRVFADRYHVRYLQTPAQVRRALCYVLNNWRHHREDRGATWRFDPFSSADLFDGWTTRAGMWERPADRPPVAAARCWLLTMGWRRHGAIDPCEVPGPSA